MRAGDGFLGLVIVGDCGHEEEIFGLILDGWSGSDGFLGGSM